MLSDKDRELISIGASIAAGCQPCTNFHLRAARIAGASDAEISQAVNDALSVSRHATEVMAQLTAEHAGAPISDADWQKNPLISELVSVSAASAVNSALDLKTHIAAARKLGATKGQILSAIKIASAIKSTAERKVEEATGRATEVSPTKSADCYNQADEEFTEQAVRAAAEECPGIESRGSQCGCHSEVKSKKS